ncbi:MAG: Hint domain-containing protein [Pirellulaceae bacterium]
MKETPAPSPSPHRRRWGSFSLRTMFVLMTVFCCWLGWEMSVVRTRQAVLRELKQSGMYQVTLASDWQKSSPAAGKRGQSAATIPTVRVWLGDQAVQTIWYPSHFMNESQPEVRRLARVFPEATLIHSPPDQMRMEPCHPGCFPRGTLVETPSGPRAVDGIEAGESILAFLPSGESQVIDVQTVFVTDNRIWKVETDAGSLFTTQTQPLCVADGTTVQAGKLQPGDLILRRQGEEIVAVRVVSVTSTDRVEKVFNLILGNSEIFVANGFLARSKPPKSGQKSTGEIAAGEK